MSSQYININKEGKSSNLIKKNVTAENQKYDEIRSSIGSLRTSMIKNVKTRGRNSLATRDSGNDFMSEMSYDFSERIDNVRSSSGADLIINVLPFHISYAYTSGANASPSTGIPPDKQCFRTKIKVVGGTEYLRHRIGNMCEEIDNYVQKKLAPYFSKLKKNYFVKHKYNQGIILANLIREAFQTDLERARAIFKWISDNISFDEYVLKQTKDARIEKLDHEKPYNPALYPEQIMEERRTIPEGYANLFVYLCEKAKINAVKVKGFAKGYSITLGDKLDEPNHIWNAVMVNNEWYLLDICVSISCNNASFTSSLISLLISGVKALQN